MAVFISCSTDAFAETREEAKFLANHSRPSVRRPLRGIQVKENTYASMRVLSASGTPIPMLDSGSTHVENGIGYSDSYANFIVQSITESRAEKQQIIETFGDDYVYFFGERPRVLDVQGVLINSRDFDWKNEFWENYERFLRGTRLVELNARLYFHFDDIVVEGYMLNARTVGEASQPWLMPLSFQIFITSYACLSRVGSVTFGRSDYGDGMADDQLKAVLPAATEESVLRKAGGAGGLMAFLSKSAEYANDARFSIQSALESVKNTLYARALVVPEGLDAMADAITYYSPLTKRAPAFGPAPTGRPIHEMVDEYVDRPPSDLDARVRATAARADNERIMYLKRSEELDAAARRDFEKAGIDTGKPSAMMAILGRGAFAAIQYTAPFAMQKVGGGKIGQADQAISTIL